MQSATSVAPWQPLCFYPTPNIQIHPLHLSNSRKITYCQALNHNTNTNHPIIIKKHQDFFFSPPTTSSCSKEQENKKPSNSNTYPHQDQDFIKEFSSLNKTQKTQKRLVYSDEDDGDFGDKVISSNMWWTDLKAAVGQRINLEGLSCAVGVYLKDRHLVVPHVIVPDIRYIDWVELKRRGFQGVVFDKDNTITVPYSLALWTPLRSSVDECKSAFGNNIAVFSNSAGLREYDPDGRKARALEFKIGIKVIRHQMKKPAGTAEEVERHFGCESSRLVMVGDRPFTDIVYGNRNGFLTILTNPLSLSEEPFIVRQVRKLEVALVKRWSMQGIQPTNHRLLPDSMKCVKDQPRL